jgi:hypothetical protein
MDIPNNKTANRWSITRLSTKCSIPVRRTERCGITFDGARFALTLYGHTVYAAWPDFSRAAADPAACPKACSPTMP